MYGLGYNLLIFVYDKIDDSSSHSSRLSIQNAIFVLKEHSGDYQTTRGIIGILERDGNKDDIVSFLE